MREWGRCTVMGLSEGTSAGGYIHPPDVLSMRKQRTSHTTENGTPGALGGLLAFPLPSGQRDLLLDVREVDQVVVREVNGLAPDGQRGVDSNRGQQLGLVLLHRARRTWRGRSRGRG
ncbi:hypothetical protein GSI_07435 [Ganoderma sinense ZZ0214-1]|uniref:Uncharacterized protein n=1 Tax=Ganoderma sinense ZZ0214-1 TaxID=1077348 RepID=A0A2G8S930_9APHY|nr:hypothetical protein GSI_07435 [Ganoderma sinense ZZ0214-1]